MGDLNPESRISADAGGFLIRVSVFGEDRRLCCNAEECSQDELR